MKTTIEILRELHVDWKGNPNRNFKTTCPQCSHNRKHKDDPCLSVRVDDSGVGVKCFNCGWSDGRYYDDKSSIGKNIRKLEGKITYGEMLAKARSNWI